VRKWLPVVAVINGLRSRQAAKTPFVQLRFTLID
jgi:hypothetical protein